MSCSIVLSCCYADHSVRHVRKDLQNPGHFPSADLIDRLNLTPGFKQDSVMVLKCCIRTKIDLKLEHSLRKKNVRQVKNCKWRVDCASAVYSYANNFYQLSKKQGGIGQSHGMV
jgi:hypothetical protein